LTCGGQIHFKESLQGAIQLSDNPKTLQDILKILRGMMRIMTKTNMQCSFLLDRLIQKGLFTSDEITRLLEEVEEQMKSAAVDPETAETERLLDLLRKFEGPPQ
jgi:polyhydroxyalkanoate synthesis regulator phasin